MTDEIRRHERYKQYALKAYNIEKAVFPKDVKLLGIAPNPKSGFLGYVLKEKDRIVIVYCGTKIQDINDLKNDANMAFRKRIPEQTTDALTLLRKVRETYPHTPIDVVGHSLGGSIAQSVAVYEKVNEAVCFAPVGIGKTAKDYIIKYGVSAIKTPENKIINYNNPDDILTKFFRNESIGTNYIIRETDPSKDKHSLEYMKPLSTRKLGNPSYRPKPKDYNSYRNFTASTGCVGSYPVSGYTRSDGTKVEGYIRTCGAKHKGMSAEERRLGQEKYKGKRFQDIPPEELETAIGYFV